MAIYVKKRRPKEGLIADVTRLTGVTKADLAFLFEVDASLLTHHEASKRSLPTRVRLPLLSVFSQTDKLKHVPATMGVDPTEKDELLSIAEKLGFDRDRLKEKLADVQLKHQQGHNMLQLLDMPIFQYPFDVELTERTTLWLDIQRRTANKKIKQNGWFAQKQLQLKIASLEHDCRMYEAAAKEMER